jgi:hypothetical protein
VLPVHQHVPPPNARVVCTSYPHMHAATTLE